MLNSTFFQTKKSLNCRGKIINLSSPVVMGVINLTPDSFFDGGKIISKQSIIKKAELMLNEGATLLDLGAASSRPGAALISSEEEKTRLLPALEFLLKEFPEAIISIDTYNSDTAYHALKAGAHIINDISAGNIDAQMFSVVAQFNVPYIIMHMKGVPQTMQVSPKYNDPVKEIASFFAEKLDVLRKFGVHDVIIDPGFGFGKTLEDNYKLLDKLEYFKMFEEILLVGVSRKSMINKVLGTSPDQALNGTTVLNTIALQKGAKILRVHDVKEAMEAIALVNMLNSASKKTHDFR